MAPVTPIAAASRTAAAASSISARRSALTARKVADRRRRSADPNTCPDPVVRYQGGVDTRLDAPRSSGQGGPLDVSNPPSHDAFHGRARRALTARRSRLGEET